VNQLNPGSLAKVYMLGSLTDAESRALEKACKWKRYSASEQIIDRQNETTDICFVVEGKVRIVNYSLSGREITLDDHAAGDCFGELSAIDGQPRSASVMALEECLVASLGQEQFHALLSGHPGIALEMMKYLAQMVRTSTERIMDLSTLAANNRVQADLLRQALTNMQGEKQAHIKPIPVHADIASRVSTTRETVARVMNDLAREGIIERRKDALVIHDVEKLQEMVELVRGE